MGANVRNREDRQRMLAISYAEHVLHFFEEEFPDVGTPRITILVAKEYLKGKISRAHLQSQYIIAHEIPWRILQAYGPSRSNAARMASLAAAYCAFVPTKTLVTGQDERDMDPFSAKAVADAAAAAAAWSNHTSYNVKARAAEVRWQRLRRKEL